MKRVYVVFEDRYSEDEWGTHEGKFIDVYDNPQAAVESIRIWAESQLNVADRKSDKMSERLTILSKISPYSCEDKIIVTHYIKSTLLKSS